MSEGQSSELEGAKNAVDFLDSLKGQGLKPDDIVKRIGARASRRKRSRILGGEATEALEESQHEEGRVLGQSLRELGKSVDKKK